MLPPDEISYRFYAVLDSFEESIVELASKKPHLRRECECILHEMEIVADNVLATVAKSDWAKGFMEFSSFQERLYTFVIRNAR
jgi:hypothetical protein